MHGEETFRERKSIRDILKPDILLLKYQADNIPDFEGTPKQVHLQVFAKIS